VDRDNRFTSGVKGTITSIRGDTLVLERTGGGDPTPVRLQPGSHVFVWEGRGSAVGVGAAAGAALGAVGAAATEAFAQAKCSANDWMCFEDITTPLLNILAGGAAGLMAGMVIGSLIPVDKWVPVQPGAVDVAPIVHPTPGGWSLGARLSF